MAASSSGGEALATWTAAVEPADVPTIKSASVTSSPASKRPAMTPTTHALPVDPPPPRTSARDVFMGVAFRDLPGGALPVATRAVARSWTAGEHPLWTLRSWGSPPTVDHDRRHASTLGL